MKLLLFLFMMMPLLGEKMEIVAYHVGKGMSAEDLRDQLYWANEDPFGAGESLKGEIKPLTAPLFKSRFLGLEDTLFDFSALFADVSDRKKGDSLNAVFNQTRGKLVFQGSERARMEIVIRSLSGFDNETYVEVKLAVYDVPNRDLDKMRGLESELPRSAKKIEEALLTAKSGEKGKIETPEWRIECEPIAGGGSYVELRLDVRASFVIEGKSHQFEFMTGLAAADGVPSYLEIGAIGLQDRTAVLAVTTTQKFIDGTDAREEYLEEKETSSVIEEALNGLRRDFGYPSLSPTQENGRVFMEIIVPPTFVSFISGSGGAGSEVDPFASDNEVTQPKLKTFKKAHPLIRWRMAGRLMDLSDLMRRQGIKIQEDDFVVLNQGTISALLPPDQMELLLAITQGSGPDIPSYVGFSITLLESNEPFTIDEIGETRVLRVNRLGLRARPGDKSTGILSSGAENLEVTLEPNIGARGSIIDLRLAYQYKVGKESQLTYETVMTVPAGQAVLTAQHQHEGKWRALLVKADHIGLDEELEERR